MATVELCLGFALPLIAMIIGYWKEEVWLFYVASALWLIIMGFLFNNYTSADFFYYVAWVCLCVSIVCATAQLWMNKGKPNPIEPDKEETIEERREKKGDKLAGLRGLKDRIRGYK